MLRPELYIGRSVEVVERFCDEGGVLGEKIKPYKAFVEKKHDWAQCLTLLLFLNREES